LAPPFPKVEKKLKGKIKGRVNKKKVKNEFASISRKIEQGV
jgi:hypothetical protein